ncbi:hypothetical protein Cni_G15445 [Canna indica]|uniref:Uncharacterized protein n=1 Tax=Canna indica TaxID=4628 RepID=A0AAQ3QBK3_9LILI|nr:hypothetical protein Cni_G15445 [Canna indica]
MVKFLIRMIARKNMGKASPLFSLIVGVWFFFATYNLVTMVIHHQRRESEMELPGDDPITRMPD